MATSDPPSPLSFGLDENLYKRLREASGTKGSVSSLIRAALEEYDFRKFQATATRQRQVSVRMGKEERQQLEKTARNKKSSVGELVRAALMDYLEHATPAENGGSAVKPSAKKEKNRKARKSKPKPTQESFAASSSAVAKKAFARTLARKRLRRK